MRKLGLLVATVLAFGPAFATDSITVVVNAKTSTMNGFVDRGSVFVSARTFLPALGASLTGLAPNQASVSLCGKVTVLPFVIRDREPFFEGVASARALGFQAAWDGTTLTVTGQAGNCGPSSAQQPGIGYTVRFSSTLEISGDGGDAGYTYQLDGQAVLDSARAGEAHLRGGSDIQTTPTYTILAEGRIPLRYCSVSIRPDKCAITGQDGFAYVMLLEAKLSKGGSVRVIAFDPGLPGGQGSAPTETVSCPGARPVGLKGWFSAFSDSVKDGLGVIFAPQAGPRPALLLGGLPDLDPNTSAESVEYHLSYGQPGLQVGKGRIVQDTLITFEARR